MCACAHDALVKYGVCRPLFAQQFYFLDSSATFGQQCHSLDSSATFLDSSAAYLDSSATFWTAVLPGLSVLLLCQHEIFPATTRPHT